LLSGWSLDVLPSVAAWMPLYATQREQSLAPAVVRQPGRTGFSLSAGRRPEQDAATGDELAQHWSASGPAARLTSGGLWWPETACRGVPGPWTCSVCPPRDPFVPYWTALRAGSPAWLTGWSLSYLEVAGCGGW